MRAIKLLTVLFLLSASLASFAKRARFENRWRGKYKSLEHTSPFEIFTNEDNPSLSICFYENLGTIELKIEDINGEIAYYQTYDAFEHSSILCPLNDLKEGIYTLSLKIGMNEISSDLFIY